MKFCVEIGEVEKHVIEFNFNQLLGYFAIKINRREVKRNTCASRPSEVAVG